MDSETNLTLAEGARHDSPASILAASYAGIAAFLAVASEGSFARAAERLGVGRSAVSRAVQRLEAQLATRLFVRTTRRNALTPEGQLFYAKCRPGVEALAEAVESVRALRGGPPQGVLRIGAPPAFGRKVVAPMLRVFQARHPGVAVELRLDDEVPDPASGRVDVAFVDAGLADGRVVARRLQPLRLITCASAEYARRHGLPSNPDDLAGHRTLALRARSGGGQPWEYRAAGQRLRRDPRARQVFNDAELVLQAVLEGDGLAQLPHFLVESPLRDGRLVACLDPFAPDERWHSLAYLGGRQMPGRVRAFVDFAVENSRHRVGLEPGDRIACDSVA